MIPASQEYRHTFDGRLAAFCPFCGKPADWRKRTGLLICHSCRMTWFVNYARQMRRKPGKETAS